MIFFPHFCSLCFPLQWFCESVALNTDDFLEKQKVYKFRGDLAVRQGNYQVIEIIKYGLSSLSLTKVSNHLPSSYKLLARELHKCLC